MIFANIIKPTKKDMPFEFFRKQGASSLMSTKTRPPKIFGDKAYRSKQSEGVVSYVELLARNNEVSGDF